MNIANKYANVMFENRSVAISNGSWTDTFTNEYSWHIYQFAGGGSGPGWAEVTLASLIHLLLLGGLETIGVVIAWRTGRVMRTRAVARQRGIPVVPLRRKIESKQEVPLETPERSPEYVSRK
jgi:hypothetical protein